eukprot:69705-Amorphochlora_amoeboformis.AAC.1
MWTYAVICGDPLGKVFRNSISVHRANGNHETLERGLTTSQQPPWQPTESIGTQNMALDSEIKECTAIN